MFNKGDGCLTFEDGSIIQKEELGVVFSVILQEREGEEREGVGGGMKRKEWKSRWGKIEKDLFSLFLTNLSGLVFFVI
jgi:hypothetical protein